MSFIFLAGWENALFAAQGVEHVFEQVGGTTVKLQHTNQFAMLGQQQPAGRGEITAHKNKFERHSVEKASLLGSLIQKTVSDSMLENGSFVIFARYKQIAEIFNLFSHT